MSSIVDDLAFQGREGWSGIVVLSQDIAWMRLLVCVIDHCVRESVREHRVTEHAVTVHTYERIVRVMVHEED